MNQFSNVCMHTHTHTHTHTQIQSLFSQYFCIIRVGMSDKCFCVFVNLNMCNDANVCVLHVCHCACVVRLVNMLHSVQTASWHNDTWSCLRASGLPGTPLRGLSDSLTLRHTHTHTQQQHHDYQDLSL